MSVGPVGLPVDVLTLERILAKGVDTVHSRSSLLTTVFNNAEDFTGRVINWHVVVSTNNTINAFTGFDPLAINPQQPLTQAALYFTNVSAAVALADDQVAVNATEAGKVDYVAAMTEHAFNTVGMKMGQMLYSDGVSSVVGTKDMVGLQAAINNVTGDNLDINGTAVAVTRPGIATYAGLSRTTYPTWSSTVRNGTAVLTLDKVYMMRALIKKASQGDMVDTVVVGPVTWTKFAALTTPTQRNDTTPSDSNPMLSIGAAAIRIGGLMVVEDVLCPEGIAYFVKSDDIKYASITPANNKGISYTVKTTEDNNFSKNPVKSFWTSEFPVRPVNQNATVFHIGTTGNFMVKKPSCHGVLTNI
jgi:hypothetical protein